MELFDDAAQLCLHLSVDFPHISQTHDLEATLQERWLVLDLVGACLKTATQLVRFAAFNALKQPGSTNVHRGLVPRLQLPPIGRLSLPLLLRHFLLLNLVKLLLLACLCVDGEDVRQGR